MTEASNFFIFSNWESYPFIRTGYYIKFNMQGTGGMAYDAGITAPIEIDVGCYEVGSFTFTPNDLHANFMSFTADVLTIKTKYQTSKTALIIDLEDYINLR